MATARERPKKSRLAARPLAALFDAIEREATDTSTFSVKDATRLVREDRDAGIGS